MSIKYDAQLTATTDANGDIVYDVRNGLNFEVTGVLATINDPYANVVRAIQVDASHYRFRIYKFTNGTVSPAINQQVTFTFATLG